jgi:pSer/pThr/pTyr-binding forkhead associated (FHA) protein
MRQKFRLSGCFPIQLFALFSHHFSMQPKHPYHEPIWSSEYQGDGPPYTLEIIKQGVSKGLISPNKKYLTIGRLPSSDIEIEHESASRNHAVIQYSKEYCFIYDLGSSHGSFLNKARVNPKDYIRVYNGDRLRFGASTRVFLLHGPKQNDRIITNTNNNANTNTRRVQNQRSWGDQEDAYEGNGWSSKFPSQTLDRKTLTKQEPYHQDPKHYISNFVSNNKVELVIEYTGKNIIECLLEINGLIGVFECKGKGKSKAIAEKDACMEACWKLSQMDILESTDQGMSDVQQRKRLLDKLGDDDQGFFDRTEKKLKVDVVEDFDSLSLKKNECEKEIDGLEVLIKSVCKILLISGKISGLG